MQTRYEHSRSIEDGPRFRALETLKRLGLLIPIKELETYHGRVGRNSDDIAWLVDPAFTNGSNDSGNSNVNSRPTLYTGERSIAEEFTQVRIKEASRSIVDGIGLEDLRAEVHDISTTDPDAVILDFKFDESMLSEADKLAYYEALRELLIPITEGSPVGFEHRNDTLNFAEAANRLQKNFLSIKDVKRIVEESDIHEQLAIQLAGAHNARQLTALSPGYIASLLITNKHGIIIETLDLGSEKQELPINIEYVEKYFREAHIVGVKQKVNSATLGKEINSVSFFDLEKINTTESIELERHKTWQKLGGFARILSRIMPTESMPKVRLKELLQDAHAKPEKLIEATKQIEGYADIFEADAGNWEGFTLAEHTETVLRNFDENYADRVPVEFLAPLRLAIILHDIGKTAATAKGEKHLQKKYNSLFAEDFLTKIGVGDGLKEIVLAVIGDGAELAFRIDILGTADEAELQKLARDTLEKFGDDIGGIEDQIPGFIEMCRILQICDGGAYTSMAVTRRTDGRGRYRNAPSFNGSFVHPNGLGKRSIVPRSKSEPPAQADLTPILPKEQSKVRIARPGAGHKRPTLNL